MSIFEFQLTMQLTNLKLPNNIFISTNKDEAIVRHSQT